jgi:ComF family protein
VFLEPLLDILFPPRCLGCREAGWPFCVRCASQIGVLEPPGCARCGRPFEWAVDRCADCPPGPIHVARAPFVYEGPVRQALMGLKFGRLRSNASALAGFMAGALGPVEPRGFEITWVPLGRRRKALRGFDQAEALARHVGRHLELRVRRLLRRTTETGPQAKRTGPARRSALRGAFVEVARPPPRLLLIDDVMTSGATAAECARILVRAGASEVILLTAARSLGGPIPARCYNAGGLWPGSVVARENVSR